MFADTDNLKSSVVITRAIPLALSLGVKVINYMVVNLNINLTQI